MRNEKLENLRLQFLLVFSQESGMKYKWAQPKIVIEKIIGCIIQVVFTLGYKKLWPSQIQIQIALPKNPTELQVATSSPVPKSTEIHDGGYSCSWCGITNIFRSTLKSGGFQLFWYSLSSKLPFKMRGGKNRNQSIHNVLNSTEKFNLYRLLGGAMSAYYKREHCMIM